MKNIKTTFSKLVKNRKGAFSIEMLIVVGIIVVLVVLAMSAFSKQATHITDQYSTKVTQGKTQQDALNTGLINAQISSFSVK